MDLLREGAGGREPDACAVTIARQGKVSCGPFEPSVARVLLDRAQERIQAAGHPLQITSEPAGGTKAPHSSEMQFKWAIDALSWHFADMPLNKLMTTVRLFPGHMRADVQVALDKLFASPIRFFGMYDPERYETLSFARLQRAGRDAISLAAPRYRDIDIGEATPIKCLESGLWLCETTEFRYAVVLSYYREYKREDIMRIEFLVPVGAGECFAQRSFDELERAVHSSRSYRGKILSFDSEPNYTRFRYRVRCDLLAAAAFT